MGKKKVERYLDELGLDIPGYSTVEQQAKVWKRALAFIIDIFILNIIIATPFEGMLMKYLNIQDSAEFLSRTSDAALTPEVLAIGAVLSVLYLAYFTILEFSLGQTLGKKLFGLYVKANTTGYPKREKIRFWQAITRNLAILPFFPFYIMWIVDPIYLLVKRERLSDRVARTGVFEEVRK